jgi:hypothetical protein
MRLAGVYTPGRVHWCQGREGRERRFQRRHIPPVTSSYIVSHHHAQCHTGRETISKKTHPTCHIIIHSVTSSCTVSHRKRDDFKEDTSHPPEVHLVVVVSVFEIVSLFPLFPPFLTKPYLNPPPRGPSCSCSIRLSVSTLVRGTWGLVRV